MTHILSRPASRTQRLFSLLNRGLVIRNLLVLVALTQASNAHGMEIQTAWIPMPDGIRLSAGKSPVLLEYLPYRKHEARSRNWPLYLYFVERGYVVAAVDIRGTGNSEGRLIPYEYSEIEQADGEVVIDWLSKQPWSSGNV